MPNDTITVREYQPNNPADAAAFRSLNEQWIRQYFVLEPKDEYTLSNPQQTILDKGGRIFFAAHNGQTLGTCALIRTVPHEFELAKMGVAPEARGLGLGKALMLAAIAAARTAGTRRLYIETNDTLTPAVTLYESCGFTPVPESRRIPTPYSRANVFLELFL